MGILFPVQHAADWVQPCDLRCHLLAWAWRGCSSCAGKRYLANTCAHEKQASRALTIAGVADQSATTVTARQRTETKHVGARCNFARGALTPGGGLHREVHGGFLRAQSLLTWREACTWSNHSKSRCSRDASSSRSFQCSWSAPAGKHRSKAGSSKALLSAGKHRAGRSAASRAAAIVATRSRT